MKLRNTLVLVAVFAALAGYVFLVEVPKPPEDTQAQDKAKYVFTLGQDELLSLQVKDGDKSVFLVKDSAGKWFVGGVGGAQADPYTMSTVLSGLVNLQASRVITDVSAGLAVYGLEKPALQADLQISAEKTESLLVGDRTPQGSTYYAQRKGVASVYLVPEYVVAGLKDLVTAPPYLATPTVAAPLNPTVGITATLPVTR